MTSPRFSSRLDWQRSENPLARAESARRRENQPVLDLTESNPTAVGLTDQSHARALAAVLGAVPAAVASYAPAPRGQAAARRAVADNYAAAGVVVDPDRLILTASSSESYSFLFKLLCDPGDAVLIPEPSYPLFDYLARLDGLTTLPYRLTHDGTTTGAWRPDVPAIADAIARSAVRVGAIVVVSPNNPTGSVLRADDLAALDRVAASAGVALVADEVFADYVTGTEPDRIRCVAARQTEALCFSLGGLSKSCGLPQLKLGWIAAGGPTAAVEAALARLDLVADTYLSVGAPVQAALSGLFQLGASMRASIAARLARNRDRLRAALGADSPATLLSSDGGWLAILRVPAIRSDEEWALALLENDGVLVHPGYFFDMRGATFLVVSLLPTPDVFDEGVSRLTARVAQGFP